MCAGRGGGGGGEGISEEVGFAHWFCLLVGSEEATLGLAWLGRLLWKSKINGIGSMFVISPARLDVDGEVAAAGGTIRYERYESCFG